MIEESIHTPFGMNISSTIAPGLTTGMPVRMPGIRRSDSFRKAVKYGSEAAVLGVISS